MELDVLKVDGTSSGSKVKLPKPVFGIEPNDHLIYQAVRCQMWNKRQGNAATKNRALVRGGGRKPWKQKGRGAARAGTSRSPLWVGGGRIFGPQPRDLNMKLTKKMKKIARVSAYSYKAKEKGIICLDELKLANAKTKEMFQVLQSLNIEDKKVLLLTNNYESNIVRAGKNIPKLKVCQASDASTYDIVNCEVLLFEQNAIEKITEVCAL